MSMGEREAAKGNTGTVHGWKGKGEGGKNGIRAIGVHRGVRQGCTLSR